MTAHRGNQKRAQFFFSMCLNFSGTEEAALKHKTVCSRKVSKMSHLQNNTLEFAFVVYADFKRTLESKNF